MLRWLLGGREPQGLVEKSQVLAIGDEQPKNPYTELQVLKGHCDIVRFLVRIDAFRFVSAGDDGIIFLWNVQTGERLLELHGHAQQITAIAAFPRESTSEPQSPLLLTASTDKTVIVWDIDSGRQLHSVSDFRSSVKCLTVLERLGLWLAGGSDLSVWNRDAELLCKTDNFVDAGICAIIEVPKNCIVVAVGKELIIFSLTVPSSECQNWDICEVRRLFQHQDTIRALANVNDLTFASGSHIGELIVWDALSWTIRAWEQNFWDTSPQPDAQPAIKMSQNLNEISIQCLTSDQECIIAAVGRGIYVYSLQNKRVIAHQKTAHDSNVLHIAKLQNSQLVSCSEDGSVRIWELSEPHQSPTESASSGLFSMWGFGKPSRQAGQLAKKTQDCIAFQTLELTGDLIGHSGAVQMFLYFKDHGLVTCSSDQLIILWKNGEKESKLRSLSLFQKLERDNGLQS
ncbi:WD repeat-containing protein 41 [Latimeria chalumnae]|uniref:WD repeat domain 41 n=1 Tax=Latimeria chalumnae TaxID=7897 RepID=H3B532_LATCH|nr:PREDICTED: WD repeat-containing protein 41 [Latimeria chalumnae]XP_005992690.1 PREDICTED: WD repeat-containing protein 41 [Latimeria chalumnae]|eukprot:XP_005992689.1 PREDICTED: WD repeat-containing protein 41 [Latimeria chalumnae]